MASRKKSSPKKPAPRKAAARPERKQRAVASGFDAASLGRRTEKWLATSSGINSLLQFSLPIMRDRVRDQARNIPWTKRAVKSWVADVIGTGIRPIPASPDKEFNKAVRDLWPEFVENCDADGRLDFYGMQTLAARSFKTGGEVLVRKLYRPTDKYDLPVPLQLQMIEADQLDHRLSERLDSGGKIVQGVELDATGARAFYHIWKEHPQEMLSAFGGTLRLKVPAKEIIHIFEPDRPGQQRGYPSMVSSVIRMLDLMEYEDAVLVRQKLAAMLMGYIKTLNPNDGGQVFETENVAGSDVPEVTFESGTLQQLDENQEIQWSPNVDPGNNYERHLQWQLRAQAADADVTYEQNSGDLRGTSFSSIRAGLNNVHRIHEQTQDNIFVHQFCRNVRNEFIMSGVMSGALPMPRDFMAKKRQYLRTKWIPQGWPYVSPADEAKASETDMRTGVTSRSAEVARRGRDVEDLDMEIYTDYERSDRLGLVFDSDPRQTDTRGTVQKEDAPSATSKDDERQGTQNNQNNNEARRRGARRKGRVSR
jgi:lambda family phage portal protein